MPIVEPSPELLREMIVQNQRTCFAGHKRLRADLTEGLNDVNAAIDRLTERQQTDHEAVLSLQESRERRKEMSGYHAVIIAAVIAGGFRLVEVILTQVAHVIKP